MFVAAATLFLIFIGGHTTTSGAGMAFPDWPLSHGSVNPDGWWENLLQRLEHGHRIMAETVGLLIGILCAWVWRNKWAVPVSIGASLLLALGVKLAGASREIVAHTGLWSSAVIFALMIVLQGRRNENARPAAVRWLAFAAFLGVIVQAIMGGLRVTIETGGDTSAATVFRVLHGCFAQIEFCLCLGIVEMLRPIPASVTAATATAVAVATPPRGLRSLRRFGWITAAVLFLQLVIGATMRHLGAGLSIPTFPRMPEGGWLPAAHDLAIDLNFTHTRLGSVVATVFVLMLAARALRVPERSAGFSGLALLLVAMVAAQFTMGMFVIWNLRPPILTTLHVVNGAALLGATVILALRATHVQNTAGSKREAALTPSPSPSSPPLAEKAVHS